MSIRPIDLQVIVPKSQNNPHTREHVVNKEAIQLQQSQMETKRISTQKDHKVNELEHKDGAKVEEKKDLTKENSKKKKSAAGDKDKDGNAQESSQKDKKPQAKDWNFHRFDMKV